MAKTVIAIKLRSMWNNATKPMWKIILTVLVTLYFGALGVMLAVGGIMAVVEGYILEFSKGAIIGSLLITVAWLILPLMGMGFEGSLKPRSFTPFVAPSKELSRALLTATPVGPAGVLTALAMLVGTVGLFVDGKIVLGIVSLLLIPVTIFVYSLISRTLTSYVSSRTMRTRKSRDITQTIATVVLLVILMTFGLGVSALSEYASGGWYEAIVTVTKWTPLVGTFAIPFLIFTGDILPAVLQAVYAIAITLVLLKIWHAMVVKAMVGVKTPITPEIQRALDEGRAVVDPSVEAKRADAKASSIDSELPTLKRWTKLGLDSPTSVIAARTFRDWIKDTRLLPTVIISLLLPAIAIGAHLLAVESVGFLAPMFLFLVPLTQGVTAGMLISYDSTAFSMQVLSGVSGRADRFGRALGSQPMMILIAIWDGAVMAWLLDFKYSVFLVIALVYALMVTVMSLMSALTGYRTFGVQPPGESAMSTKGSANQFLLGLIMAAIAILAPTLNAPAAFAAFFKGGNTMLVDNLIGVGALVWGIGLHVGFLLLGAYLYERNQAQILTQIRSWPGH